MTDLPPWRFEAHQHFVAGRYGDALVVYEDVLTREPEDVIALQGACVSALHEGKIEDAARYSLTALTVAPHEPNPHMIFGALMLKTGRFDEAEGAYRRALALAPEHAAALTQLGYCSLVRGQVRQAVEQYRRALAVADRDPVVRAVGHSNLIFLMDMLPEVSGMDALKERLDWNEEHAEPLTREHAPHTNERDPDRPLKIGYVGADFMMHSSAFIYSAILPYHDPYDVEVYVYSGTEQCDGMTISLLHAATKWTDIRPLDDGALAQRIREDGIDILVDLAGHSRGARTLTFARKPAPIQISAWGHAQGTGIRAMDYLMADRVVAPPECAHFYREALIYLPSIIAYKPPRMLPPVGPLPALTTGHITFGSFNRLIKVNDYTLDLWAEVLRGVPDARMLLKGGEFKETGRADVLRRAFSARDVDPARLIFEGPTSHDHHVGQYGRVDIALDPYPHSGGITALEGLWMGVPSVTLIGDRIPSRLAASFVTTCGYPELAVRTPEEYVWTAVRWSQDPERLAAVRASLRPRLAASPMMDYATYTRTVEAAYREVWQRWCRDD